MGIPAGIFIFSPLSQLLIDELGWRTAWLVLGLSGGAVIVAVALLVIRRDPRDMGLEPDGLAPGAVFDASTGTSHAAEYSWTREQAIRSPTFWRLVSADGLRMLSISTLGLFRIPFYIERGVDAQVVALALSAEAISSVFAAIPAGWAVDRFQPRYAAAISSSTMVLTFFVSMNVTEAWHVFAATMLFGVSAASFVVIQGAMWPSYFGGANIGGIRGFAMPFTLVLSGLGAPLTGMVKDETGSYTIAWTAGMIGMAVAALILLLTPKPGPPAGASSRR
jgi:cyanate permease